MSEVFKHKLVKVNRKLNNVDQVMDIAKCNNFKRIWGIGQQINNLYCEDK